MARSNGLGDFAKRMEVIADNVMENITLGVRKAALAADQVAVMETPVDTGRAKANWLPSIGSPAAGTVDPPVPGDGNASETFAMLRANQVIQKWQAGRGQSIFLTNNLPYIVRLEEGWSDQGRDMAAHALEAAQYVLRKHRLLKGV